MNVRKKIRQLPLRLSAGGYVINSGLSKWNADETTAKELQAFAAGTYPFLAKLDPQLFVKALSATEMAVGAAVFLPFVPSLVAGTALTAFSGGLLGLYTAHSGDARGGQSATDPAGHPAGQGCLAGRYRRIPHS